MRGLLVRVGIDSTDGRWNAPMRLESREFAYITITETKAIRDGMARYYDEFIPVAARYVEELPKALLGQPTHLDPDFEYLTFGDQGQRGKRISTLSSGDLLAFFAALRPVDSPPRPLIYALIGLYMIEDGDIVVRARPGVSGRLRRCLLIGELRNRVYRVRNELLDAWGNLDIKDGFIHRSVQLPEFRDAEKFYRWFLNQHPEFLAENNPA
jgi:hypothetical protein